jgi:hypothetical protein
MIEFRAGFIESPGAFLKSWRLSRAVAPARNRTLRRFAAGYCLLWLLTATWGLRDVNAAFKREFDRAKAEGGQPGTIPIPGAASVDIYSPYHQGAAELPSPVWRWRNLGYPVAPFVIIDQAGVKLSSTEGKGGRRIIFWLFGWSHPFWIKYYWRS